jgi:hypothetical protein
MGLTFLLAAALSLFMPGSAPASSEGPILFIGDSISYGKFGEVIDSAMRKISENVVSEASCGSTPATWVTMPGQPGHVYKKTVCGFWKKEQSEDLPGDRSKEHYTPKIEEEIQRIHPRITIVQLGTNIAAADDPERQITTIRQLMHEIKASGSSCIWIGPPDADSRIVTRDKLKITDEMLMAEAHAQGCFYVDTLSFTSFPPGPGDGIHPSPKLSEQWADEVLERIRLIRL